MIEIEKSYLYFEDLANLQSQISYWIANSSLKETGTKEELEEAISKTLSEIYEKTDSNPQETTTSFDEDVSSGINVKALWQKWGDQFQSQTETDLTDDALKGAIKDLLTFPQKLLSEFKGNKEQQVTAALKETSLPFMVSVLLAYKASEITNLTNKYLVC